MRYDQKPDWNVRRTHPGAEPSDPPPSPHGTAYHVRGMYDSLGRMSKRIAFMLSIWGTISTTVSTAVIWYSTHQGYVTEDRAAKLEAIYRDQDRKLDLILFNIGELRPRVDRNAENDRVQDERITRLEERRRK